MGQSIAFSRLWRALIEAGWEILDVAAGFGVPERTVWLTITRAGDAL
jgi:hypothetical protein